MRTQVFWRAYCAAATLICCCGAAYGGGAPSAAAARVLLISVDGLPPAWLDDPTLALPRLRALRAHGSAASGLVGVLPTTTYPMHTTLITGTFPDRHRIVDNRIFDPTGIHHDAWYWYAEDVRVPTLLQVARRAGLQTASVEWPVTVGAAADWLLPEYWRDRTALDFKLLRALSTPGLFEAAAARLGPAGLAGPLDSRIAQVACAILERADPSLLLVHFIGVDEALHRYGVGSEAGRQAAQTADAALGALLDALESAGRLDSSAVLVVSDHGFKDVVKSIRPAIALRAADLLSVDAGRVVSWRAAAHPAGGTCLFYLADQKDQESRAKLGQVVDRLAAAPENGIRHTWSADELRQQHADPDAVLGLLATDGYAFAHALTGPLVAAASRPGEHGYAPDDPDMFGVFIAAGAGIRPDQRLETIQAIDVAPTIAALLGLDLPQAQGHPLTQLLLK